MPISNGGTQQNKYMESEWVLILLSNFKSRIWGFVRCAAFYVQFRTTTEFNLSGRNLRLVRIRDSTTN